ncbi:MAG: UDP-glucose 4-epimerase GalE [Nevskiales bacterium]
MKRILVTGGAGYIGSHSCKALAAAGYEPVTMDNLSRGHRHAVKWGPFIQADIQDAEIVRQVVKDFGVVAVLHFAGYAYVGESMQEPAIYFGNNVCATYGLLEALRATSLRDIVFSSTCAIYGEQGQSPVSEQAAQEPESTYGLSKLMVEKILNDYCRAYDFRSVSLRYFNAAGADADGGLGEEHDPEPHIVPTVLAAARDGNGVTLNGNDYPTADGTCVRDFTHVTDLAEAHVAALERLLEGGSRRAYNLGSGKGCSLRQLVSAAERVTGKPIETRYFPRRPGDPSFAVANCSLAATELGWQARRSELDNILQSAWAWMNRTKA